MPNYDSKSLDQVKDLATEAAIQSLVPETNENVSPCPKDDVSCTRRWLEAFSDCA
jgi:hypothetical protein